MKPTALIIAFSANTLATTTIPKPVSFFDNFDSPPSSDSPIAPALALVDGTAGGALHYNAFAYAEHNLTSATLVPNTPPYDIGSGLATQLEEGTPGWRVQNSSILSFTEKSIYYSCQLFDVTGHPAVPTKCTIQANGTTTTGKKVTQSFLYEPAPILAQSTFTEGKFSASFTGLVNVTVGIVPQVEQALTIINFDSHKYTAVVKA